MVSVEYAVAYSEVLGILRYVKEEEINKIPKEMLEIFRNNSNKDYKFKYNPNKTLEEQNVSTKARYIIAILFRDYWATPYQKEKIKQKEKYDLQKYEEELREKYNPDNIFKNRHIQEEQIVNSQNELVEYKEQKWYQKLFMKILKLFKK